MSADGKIDLEQLSTFKAAPGSAIVLRNGKWTPGTVTTAVLFVSDAADGPPTDGSVLWYVEDESC